MTIIHFLDWTSAGKGITATMCRNGFFNMVYFGFYHSAKNHFPEAADRRLGWA